jgi:hypothetical protein
LLSVTAVDFGDNTAIQLAGYRVWKRRFTKITLCRIIERYLTFYFAAPLKGQTMTVNLSPLAGAGWQFFDNNGVPLSGGLLYTYAAGTTTPAVTYTSNSGVTPHANPIVLDSAGRVSSEVWLTSTDTYKFNLKTAAGADIWVKDNIPGILPANATAADILYNQGSANAVTRSVTNRLQDYVSVKDFGAVGDDVANDTAAFAAAAASGKSILIPQGTYRVAGVLFTTRVTFAGNAKIRRTGGSLAFSGGIDAPCEQIFLDAVGTAQVDINNTLTPEGWVDWFGYDANAIETCHAIFLVNRLGPRDYFLDRTVILDKSYRDVIGCGGSAEGAGGTRLVMIGAAAANQPLVQVGTLNSTAVLSCARRLNISGINTIRAGATYQPVASGRREDAIPGWNIKGWYEGRMEDCFDFGSAIHYKINATIGCTLIRCGGVRPTPGAINGYPDFYTAFVVGGYSPSFGFIGANASITIDSCGTAGGTGNATMGMYLYGYIGDTWVKKFEDSQLSYGIFVDGADAAGVPVTSLSAHQDVRVRECVLDNHSFNCLTVQNINTGGGISLDDNYCAQNGIGDAVLINNCQGLLSINSGDIILNSSLANYGVRIAGSRRVTVSPAVKIKDAQVGLKAESSRDLRLEPNITRAVVGGTNGFELAGVVRSYIHPIIDSNLVVFDFGIIVDTSTAYSELNITNINYGCFTTPSADRKIWYNGATWGGGGTFGTNNIATGVLN